MASRVITFGTSSMAALLALAMLSGCQQQPKAIVLFPPAADLRPEEKPRLQPADLGSEAALDAHDIAVETWGERGWRAVGRICRWAVANGATLPFECAPPPVTPPPSPPG